MCGREKEKEREREYWCSCVCFSLCFCALFLLVTAASVIQHIIATSAKPSDHPQVQSFPALSKAGEPSLYLRVPRFGTNRRFQLPLLANMVRRPSIMRAPLPSPSFCPANLSSVYYWCGVGKIAAGCHCCHQRSYRSSVAHISGLCVCPVDVARR